MQSEFITLIYSSKDVARKFIRLLSNNLEEMENLLLDMAYQSVRQRVAGALLNISAEFPDKSRDDVITVSRRDISTIVGTALNR